MKRLDAYRHTIGDGQDQTVGPKGFEIAFRQGKNIDFLHQFSTKPPIPPRYDKLFHGPQIQNAQSALAFVHGLGYVPNIMPIINLGDERLLREIATDAFKAAIASGLSVFAAVYRTHNQQEILTWADQCRKPLKAMFDAMKDGESAAGLFYGIPIMLAAMSLIDDPDRAPKGWDDLKEMEGLIFTDSQEVVSVAGKIGLAPAPEAEIPKAGIKPHWHAEGYGEGLAFVADEK